LQDQRCHYQSPLWFSQEPGQPRRVQPWWCWHASGAIMAAMTAYLINDVVEVPDDYKEYQMGARSALRISL
jgi:hypothetical protein